MSNKRKFFLFRKNSLSSNSCDGNKQLTQLLYWITCLSALPMNGLERKIQLVPRHQGFNAHTCFFQLEVYSLHNKYEDFRKTFLASLEQAQAGVFVEYLNKSFWFFTSQSIFFRLVKSKLRLSEIIRECKFNTIITSSQSYNSQSLHFHSC